MQAVISQMVSIKAGEVAAAAAEAGQEMTLLPPTRLGHPNRLRATAPTRLISEGLRNIGLVMAPGVRASGLEPQLVLQRATPHPLSAAIAIRVGRQVIGTTMSSLKRGLQAGLAEQEILRRRGHPPGLEEVAVVATAVAGPRTDLVQARSQVAVGMRVLALEEPGDGRVSQLCSFALLSVAL